MVAAVFKAESICMRWRGGSDGGLADLSGENVTKGGGMRFAFPPYAYFVQPNVADGAALIHPILAKF
jgi:hypothetical protein